MRKALRIRASCLFERLLRAGWTDADGGEAAGMGLRTVGKWVAAASAARWTFRQQSRCGRARTLLPIPPAGSSEHFGHRRHAQCPTLCKWIAYVD
jgi:hypothetical protein